jgi:lambda family phage tail tape measure protein
MEGGFSRNIRAAEYFGSSLKFLAPVMETAFPIVGAVTLGYALVEMGEHAYEAFQNIVELRGAIEGLNKLQINVASTVNKNNDAAESSVESILEATQGKSAALKQRYSYQSQKPIDLSSYFYSKEFSGLDTNIKANYETLYKSVAPADVPARLKSIRDEITNVQAALAHSKDQNSGGFEMLVGGYGPSATQDPTKYYEARLQAAKQVQALLESGSTAKSASLQSLQIDIPKAQTEERKQRAQEALAAQREAQAKIKAANAQAVADEEQMYAKWQSVQTRSLADNVAYWAQRLADTKTGSAAYYKEVAELTKATTAQHKSDSDALGRFTTGYFQNFTQTSGLLPTDSAKLSSDGKANADWITSLRESIDLTRQNSDAMAEYGIQMAVATGQMTKLEAARATAALHQQEYQQGLKEFNDRAAAINQDVTLDDAQKRAALQANANQRSQFVFAGTRQQQQDQYALSGGFNSPGVGATDALNDFVDASKDAANAMREVVTNTLRGLNASIVSGLTGGKTNFGQVAANAGRGLLGAGLNAAEGSVLGALGFGKMGSKSNPLYVVNVGTSVGGSTASALASLIPSSKGSGVAGFFGGLMKTVLPFLATGGDFSDGAVVGEAGPEIVTGSGHVTSNRSLRSMLNQGPATSISYSIDARGTDPVQTEQRVRTALVASHQSSVTQAVKTVHQDNVRRPARR